MATISESFTKIIKPIPHPLKVQLQQLGITVGAAASYVGRSYPYVLGQLNGVHPMQPITEEKIKQLIELVKFSK